MKLLYFVMGITVGLIAFKVCQILGAAQFPEEDRAGKMLPIRFANLAPADQWLQSCVVKLVPLTGIYSDRKYFALVIVPNKNLDQELNRKSTVYLRGYTARNEIKPIILTIGSDVSPKSGSPSFKLLDFGVARGLLPLTTTSALDLVITSTAD